MASPKKEFTRNGYLSLLKRHNDFLAENYQVNISNYRTIDLPRLILQKISFDGMSMCDEHKLSDFKNLTLDRCSFVNTVLGGTCFVGSAFDRCNFLGANLNFCTLNNASFQFCENILDLGARADSYRILLVNHDDGHIIVKAGCRWFTVEQAFLHWGSENYHTRKLGQETIIRILGGLKLAKTQGWKIVEPTAI